MKKISRPDIPPDTMACFSSKSSTSSTMDDLHEADVMWPEDRCHRDSDNCLPSSSSSSFYKQPQKQASLSAPIGIPTSHDSAGAWSFHMFTGVDDAHDIEEYNDSLEVEQSHHSSMVPPHLLLAARRATRGCQNMAFSVSTGQGGTLKGRNLSEVRDAVLRLTGFIESEA